MAVICGRVTCLPHPALLCHTHLLTRRKPDVWRELSAIPISWTAGAWATFRSLLAGLRRAQAQACIGGAEDGFWAFAARSDACKVPHHAACHRHCMFSRTSPGMAHATCSRCPGLDLITSPRQRTVFCIRYVTQRQRRRQHRSYPRVAESCSGGALRKADVPVTG